MQEISKIFIEDRIKETIETLYSIERGKVYRGHDIYNLTGHEGRYSALNYGLSILSMPLIVVTGVIKFFSGGIISINKTINIPDILKDKMDKSITKKILYGLKNITAEELSNISSKVLQSWMEEDQLILRQEESLVTKLKNYVYENIPYAGLIKNFWVKGGINYSKDQLNEQKLIKQITSEIFKFSYMSGKKAKVLEAEDIYNHFKEIGAYKEKLLEEDKSIATASCKYDLINAYDNQGFALEEKLVKQEAVVKQEEMAVLDQGVEQNNQVNISDVLQMLSLIYLTELLNIDSAYHNYHYAVHDDVQGLIGDNLSSNNSDFMFGNSHMICCIA